MSHGYDRAISRRLRALPAALALIALVSGCGEDDPGVPVACDTSAQAVQTALKRAPGAVRLDGVRLSDCFTRAADPAQIQQVGGTFVDAAEALADRMRKAPRSQAAVELGYLIGAVHRGAGNTQGIHYETVRRIDQVLVGLDRRSPEFARGERAGMRSG